MSKRVALVFDPQQLDVQSAIRNALTRHNFSASSVGAAKLNEIRRADLVVTNSCDVIARLQGEGLEVPLFLISDNTAMRLMSGIYCQSFQSVPALITGILSSVPMRQAA